MNTKALMLFFKLNQQVMHLAEAHPKHQRAVRLMAEIRAKYL